MRCISRANRYNRSVMRLAIFAALLLGWSGAFAQKPAATQGILDKIESRYVYFGIAGPSGGQGALGHSFLIFTAKPKVFLSGYAYQYNVPELIDLVKKEGQLGLAKRLAHGSLPMVLTREDALGFIQYYSNQDRLVTLYPLRLNAIEVQALQRHLEQDRAERIAHPREDYDVYSNNCMTRLTDALRDVLGTKSPFESNWSEGGFKFTDLLSPDAWSANIPLSFELTLRKSTHVDQTGIYQLKPLKTNLLKENLRVLPLFTDIAHTCNWSEQKTKTLWPLLINPSTRYTNAFLRYFVEQLKSCSALPDDTRLAVLDLISFDLEYYIPLSQKKRDELQALIQ